MRTSVKFKPMPGKIAIQRAEGREFTESGLVIPAAYRNKSQFGTVVAIYEPFIFNQQDMEETEAYVKVGDKVIFGQHSGVEVTVGGETVTILKEAEILTKFETHEEDDNAQHQGPSR